MNIWSKAAQIEAPQEEMVAIPFSELSHLVMVENAAKNFVSVMADFSGGDGEPFAHLETKGDYAHAIVMQALSELCILIDESWAKGRAQNGFVSG